MAIAYTEVQQKKQPDNLVIHGQQIFMSFQNIVPLKSDMQSQQSIVHYQSTVQKLLTVNIVK
jgi:hypothetical protein